MAQAGSFDSPQARPVRMAGAVTKLQVPGVPDVAAAKQRYDAACVQAQRLYRPRTPTDAWREVCLVSAEQYRVWRLVVASARNAKRIP